MDDLNPAILTIPGISYAIGAMIVAELGDFRRFDSPDKLLAYAGLSPSTYQSWKLKSTHSHMEKQGSKYLRYAPYNAAKYVCHCFVSTLPKNGLKANHTMLLFLMPYAN